MQINTGVTLFIAYAILDHKERYSGKRPMSIWISEASMEELKQELAPVFKRDAKSLSVIRIDDVPIHASSAEAPYLRTYRSELEIL